MTQRRPYSAAIATKAAAILIPRFGVRVLPPQPAFMPAPVTRTTSYTASTPRIAVGGAHHHCDPTRPHGLLRARGRRPPPRRRVRREIRDASCLAPGGRAAKCQLLKGSGQIVKCTELD